jgi:adenylyltransferase/sulfurtransferase
VVGTLQALEALKWMLEIGDSLMGRLLVIDGLRLRFRELAVRKDPACPVCGTNPTITELIDYEAFCGVGAGSASGGSDAEVEPGTLSGMLGGATRPLVIDVREPWEHAIARLDHAVLIPLGELAARLGEVSAGADIVTYCHHGVRSLQARDLLRAAGFSHVRSLRGGIDAWAREVEPGMARY